MFAKLIGLHEASLNYSLEECKKYIEALEFI